MIGALYLTRRRKIRFGIELLDSRTGWLRDHIEDRIETAIGLDRLSLKDPKSQFQERCQAIGLLVTFSHEAEGVHRVVAHLRSHQSMRGLAVSMPRIVDKPHNTESVRRPETRLAAKLIAVFDSVLGTQDTFLPLDKPSPAIAGFLIEQLRRFADDLGPRGILARVESLGSLGLLGTRMIGSGKYDDFARWVEQLKSQLVDRIEAIDALISTTYRELAGVTLSVSPLVEIARTTLAAVAALTGRLDPLDADVDVRITPEFKSVSEFARLARLLIGAPTLTSVGAVAEELRLLARGVYAGSVEKDEGDAPLLVVPGAITLAVHSLMDNLRGSASLSGECEAHLSTSDLNLLIHISYPHARSSVDRILGELKNSRFWGVLRELVPITDVFAQGDGLTACASCISDGGPRDIARRLSWSMRYAIPASETNPLVNIGGLLHDVKNELVAFQLAARAALKAASMPDRYRLAAESSNHAESAKILVRRAETFLGAVQPLSLEEVEVNAFFRAFTIDVMSWLPSTISLAPPSHNEAAKIRTDQVQLRSVLLNLCRNAAEAMPDGGIIELEWLWDPTTRMLEIEVCDSGPGLKSHQVEALNSGRAVESTKVKGSGAGLMSVLVATGSLGGKVEFDSVLRGGTVVRLAIPSLAAEGVGETEGGASKVAAVTESAVEV